MKKLILILLISCTAPKGGFITGNPDRRLTDKEQAKFIQTLEGILKSWQK